ncbi:enediyne biosynthesis protein [Streptosporangium sp. NPDC049644]|uniref:enediyne biosynthesis protein n=1 Tax=Streptosporangium sp. NPDC049644 TaxID=3155507 RepID=UPI00341C19BF
MAEKTNTPPHRDPKIIKALRRFAISITILNILGYAWWGFEQAYAWPFVALATGYSVEIALEAIAARTEGRAPRFLGNGFRGLVEFLYPAHITSIALNMLIYVNDQILIMMFGVIVAIGAKWVLRAPVRGRLRHFMNPSNFGITVILIVFPWASIAPPYHFSENVANPIDWIIPVVIIILGTMLNSKLTNRMWLIGAWVGGFALQGIIRGLIIDDTSIPGNLSMMTGIVFVLFTNYMITDPGTTPSRPLAQVAFGGGTAAIYGLLTGMNIPYGLFFSTAAACLIRGGFLWALYVVDRAREQETAQARTEAPPALTAPPGEVAKV